MLAPGGEYHVEAESPAWHHTLLEVRKEVGALLSPVCNHPNIVELIGVVVDHFQRPIKLVFELADGGDLAWWVKFGRRDLAPQFVAP